MSDLSLSDIDFKNKVVWVWTTLKPTRQMTGNRMKGNDIKDGIENILGIDNGAIYITATTTILTTLALLF